MPRRAAPGILCLLLLAAAPAAIAQDAAPSPETLALPTGSVQAEGSGAVQEDAPEPDDRPEQDLFLQTLPFDIASTDYYGLVAWLRSLGLSEAGGVEDLRGRLYGHFGVQPPSAAPSKRTMIVESADESRYFSAGEGTDASVLFTGGVALSIKDDESGETIRLKAELVRLNRDANLLFARGNVSFERQRPDGTEYFVGEVLEIDLDSQSGLFLEGQSARGEGEERLSFRADDIQSKGSGVLVLTDGEISSCDEEYPHYSIRASKIWILGGNEWAMLNATLSVGEIPVLYLPFFYYPGEELVFHPVFGFEDRRGRFVQTTTYVLGEKSKQEASISLFKLSEGGADYERELRGVFLRSTDERKKSAGTDFIKVFADIYTSLGYFAGTQLKLDELGPFSSLSAALGLGVSRSIFPSGFVYTPFVEAGGFESVWNGSYFLGFELPLRFGLDLNTRMSLGPLSLTLSLPLYSDPFFEQDFLKRSEHMDWFSFMSPETPIEAPGARSSFVDRIDGNWSLPSASLPSWLSGLSVSRLSSSLSWASKDSEAPLGVFERQLYDADPARRFFYPDQLTYLDLTASLSGTIFSYGGSAQPAEGSARAGAEASLLSGLVKPWSELSADDADAAGPRELDAAGQQGEEAIAGPSPAGFILPDLIPAASAPTQKADSASLSWQLSPSARWDRRFKSADWSGPEDVDWNPLYELYNARLSGALNFNAELFAGLLGTKLSLNASAQAQERPISNDVSLAAAWALQDAQYRNDRLGASFGLRGSPFLSSWLWSASSLSYDIDAALYDYAFAGMAGSQPEYEAQYPGWNAERIKNHALGLKLSAQPAGLAQSLSLQASLPPLSESYTAKLDMNLDLASISAQLRYYRPSVDADFVWSPLSSRLSVGKAPWPVLSSSFIWDTEQSRPSSLSNRLAWGSLSADFNLRRAQPYTLDEINGWQAGNEAFLPAEAQLSINESWSPAPVWKNRIAWSIKASATARQSFLRFTDSYMDFSAGFSLSIHEFLDLSFSSTSRNSSLWRYYPGAFALPSGLAVEPVNPIVDIVKSFNFFDRADREAALFKLKALSFKAVHKLHDWDLSLDLSLNPVLSGSNSYEFLPSVTVLLAWRSVPEIKTSYKLENEEESWD